MARLKSEGLHDWELAVYMKVMVLRIYLSKFLETWPEEFWSHDMRYLH
jgi:hypothetical protein